MSNIKYGNAVIDKLYIKERVYLENNSKIDIEPSFEIKNSNFDAVSNRRYGIDTRNNTVTANLPSSPQAGDAVFFLDAFGTFATHNLIIDGNGKTILGTNNLSVTVNNDSIGAMFNGEEWRLYE